MARALDDVRADRAAPVLEAGRLFAVRYRLEHQIAAGPKTTLWQAVDEVLARPVAVRVLTARADQQTRDRFLAAAGCAGRVSHPRAARVFDAGTEQGSTYLVGEWVDGVPLARILQDGALPATQAAFLAAQVCEALVAAHARGVAHGNLHPGNVLVGGDLRVKVTDFAVAAVSTDSSLNFPLRRAGPSSPPAAVAAAADLRAVGALLYASLTGRWPGPSAFGLPGAPVRDDGICTPRQIRAGVPSALDGITGRLLDLPRRPGLPALTSADEALAQLRALLGDPARDPARHGQRVVRRRRRAPPAKVLAGAAITMIAATGWFAGYHVGRLPGDPARPLSLSAPVKQPAPTAAGAPLPLAAVTDFDPPPGDGSEQASFVNAAYDGDRSTAWMTDRYLASPDLGGLKPGVGLLVDLGRPTPVGRVTVALSTPGATVELRAANQQDQPPRTLDGVMPVDVIRNAGADVSLAPRGTTAARFWLIWLTQLPAEADGSYRDGITELAFFRSG